MVSFLIIVTKDLEGLGFREGAGQLKIDAAGSTQSTCLKRYSQEHGNHHYNLGYS